VKDNPVLLYRPALEIMVKKGKTYFMARIVLSTIGVRGDLNPFLSLGLGLRARGHDVLFAVEDTFCQALMEEGFAVHRLPGDVREMLLPYVHELVDGFTPLTSLQIILHKWILPSLHAKVQELRKACSGADLLVARAAHLAAPIVAELTGIPWVHITMTPLNIPSAYVHPYLLPLLWPSEFPPIVNRIAWNTMQAVLRNVADKQINGIRAMYGLRPGHDLMGVGNHSHLLTAVVVSPAFLPPPSDWPAYVRMTGFCFWDVPSSWHEDAKLTAFLDSSEPVIAVSFGSIAPFVKDVFARLYSTSIAAIRRLGARALVIGATTEILPEPAPDGVYAVPFAPFSQVYPRCAVVIHHGGPYTVAEALRAGIPSLVIPWGIDQFFTAAQVKRLGVGEWVHQRFYTAAGGARTLHRLLNENSYKSRTQTIASQLTHEDGVVTLCEAIEGLLQRL
jgi:UDP:flavonoid glycosyltransferase YjiC (YdhE family)